jgi:hypothetical protein
MPDRPSDIGGRQAVLAQEYPVDDDGGLDFHPRDILKAFELAHDHYSAKGKICERLENRWQVALGIFDRACMECDRGRRLLELTNKVADLEAENTMLRKGNGGSITIWPIP